MAFIQQPFRPKQQTNQSGVIGGSEEQPAQEGQEAVSNWTNLNAYISGNQGQGAAIADKLLESGNQEVGKFKTAGEDFAKAATDQATQGAKKDTWSSLFKDGDVGGMTADQKRAYTEWKNSADYSGPQDASQAKGYGDVSTQFNKTKGEVARSATLTGQAGLAKDSFGKSNNNYNAGMSMLDSIIARQAGGGEKLDAFQSANKDLSMDGVKDTVNKSINAAKAQGKAAGSSAQSALDNRLGGLAGILHDREASGGYVNDLTRRDMATDPELAAIDNLLELGASAGDNMRSDLSNLSGNDKVTKAERADQWVKENGQLPGINPEPMARIPNTMPGINPEKTKDYQETPAPAPNVGQVAATVDVGDVKDEGYTIEEADDDPTMPGVVKVNQRKRK